MNKLKLLEAINMIDDDLVEEADVKSDGKEINKPFISRRRICAAGSVAAAAAVAIGAAAFYSGHDPAELMNNGVSSVISDDTGDQRQPDRNESIISPTKENNTGESFSAVTEASSAFSAASNDVSEGDYTTASVVGDNSDIPEEPQEDDNNVPDEPTAADPPQIKEAPLSPTDFDNDGIPNDFCHWIGEVIINGKAYMQTDISPDAYTPAEYLGTAADFEGQYTSPDDQKWCALSYNDEIYSAAESDDVLIARLSGGGAMILLHAS